MSNFLIGDQVVQPGDVIEFRYNSGSNPGAIRVVKVREVKPNGFTGIDVDRNAFRHFALRYMEAAKFVRKGDIEKSQSQPAPIPPGITFLQARQALYHIVDSYTGEQLANAYALALNLPQQMFDKVTGRIIPAPRGHSVVHTMVTAPNGNTIDITDDSDNGITVNGIKMPSYDDAASAIRKFAERNQIKLP